MHPVPADAPLYMGFKSGFRKNQASEDDVTIADGPFAGGTTMHVSYMRLRLDSWYGVLDENAIESLACTRPSSRRREVSGFTDDAPSRPGRYATARAPIRRRRPLADLGPSASQRPAADPPARLRHARRQASQGSTSSRSSARSTTSSRHGRR